jgi:uncharacterized protein with beta-barrel porin domain
MVTKISSEKARVRLSVSEQLAQSAYNHYGATMVSTTGQASSKSIAKRAVAVALLSSSSLLALGTPTSANGVCSTVGDTTTCTGPAITASEVFAADNRTIIATEAFDQNTSGRMATSQGSNVGILLSGNNGTIRNSGRIVTGEVANEGMTPIFGGQHGVFVVSTSGNGEVENTATGRITTTGPLGIALGATATEGGHATAVNRGVIVSTGSGVAATAISSTATATNAAGASITTSGDYSAGLVVTGSTVVGTNNGTIASTGEYAIGLAGNSFSVRTTTLTNTGAITVSGGDDTKAIQGFGPTVHISNTSTGTLNATGSGARGIFAVGDTVNVTNDGAITASGTENVIGIFGNSYGLATTNITNTGSIDVTGANSFGIFGFGPTVNITNSGSVNKAIVAGGAVTTTVNEGGTVGDGENAFRILGRANTLTIRGTGNDINGAIVAADEGGMSTLNFQQTDTLTLDDGSGMGVAIKDFDTINFNSGTTRFTGTTVSSPVGIANITGGGTLTTGSPAFAMDVAQLNVSGMGTTRGTVSVPAGSTITVSGDVTFGDKGRFQPGIASDTSAGILEGTHVTFNAGSEVYADVTRGIDLTDGNASKVAGATMAVVDNGLSVFDNSVLFSFTHEVRTGNELYLIAKHELRAVTATNNNNGRTTAQNIASAIDVFIENLPNDNPIVAYLAQFPVAEQEAKLFELVKDSLPEESGSTGSSAVASADMVLDLIMGRLANGSLASLDSASGVSAGEQLLGGTGNWAIWGQASASFADYNPAVVNGFESDTYAISGGIDGDISEDLRLGLSLFYSNTNIDETGAGANSAQDIEGVGALLYGTYRPAAFYVNGTLGVGLNEYESTRNSLGGVNRADYDGYQLISSAELGKTFTDGNWEVSPHIGARFNYVAIEGYTETGPLPTSVGSQNITSLRGILGLSGRYTHKLDDGSNFIPEGYVRAIREMADPNGAVTGSVVGGGTFVSQAAQRDNLAYALGLGAVYEMDGSTSLRVLYEGEYQEDYQEHSLSAAVRFQF